MIVAVGDLVEDVVVLLSGPPNPGSDLSCSVSRHRGGSAANVAAVAARLGGRARFVGQVGADDLGDRLVGALVDVGVDPVVRRAGRTATIVVLVDPAGERTMLTDRGASVALADPDRAWLDGACVLHLPAYSLTAEPLASAARTLAGWASEAGMPVTVDASSTAVLDGFGPAPFLDLLADLGPAVLFANAAEAECLGIRDRAPAGVGLVVLKDGSRPVRLLSNGASSQVAVPAVGGVVDTTGAGDAFAAGFLLAWLGGADSAAAAEAGHAAAAHVVRGSGGDAWVP